MATLLTGNGYYPVTAQQDADLYQGIIGGDHVKVLPVGGQMAYTLSGNTVTIADGECVDSEGRRYHIDVWSSDSVTIPTGTVGVTKYYIIGFVVSTDTSGNQTADTFYQEVDYASSTIDEDLLRDGYGTKYVSLYRVTQAGVSITDITALFELSRSLADLEEDIDSAVDSINDLGDDLDERAPFKLGISDDGTYGYIKNGSTEVTGFRYPTGDATAADLLAGKVASSYDEEDFTGTMPDNGTVEEELTAGESYELEEGHYDGGTITAADLASQTEATATAAVILEGETAWVNGELVTGTLEVSSDGATGGTAEASDILEGETAWVDGSLIAGTMPDNGTVSETLDAGESYELDEGHYDGGTITATDLASQTIGTATASEILEGETAWVNGEKITGTLEVSSGGSSDSGSDSDSDYDLAELTPGTATAEDIIYGETAWVDGEKITGTMVDFGAVTETFSVGETSELAEGHYDSITIEVEDLESATPATATAADILEGETAWVNGEKITGTLVVSEETSYAVDSDTEDGTYYINSDGTVVTVVISNGEVTSMSDTVSDGEYTLYSDEALTEDSGSALVVTTELTGTAGTSYAEEATEGVNFRDLYGNVLYAWTWDEIDAAEALPDPVDITSEYGVELAQTGWNWTLEELQGWTARGFAEVGAVYCPADGMTHIIADVAATGYMCLTLGSTSTDDSITVSWGDGATSPAGGAETTSVLLGHSYANDAITRYDITISATSGSYSLYSLDLTDTDARVRAVYLATDSITYSYAFRYCLGLDELTFAEGANNGLAYLTYNEVKLRNISLPQSMTTLSTYSLYNFSGNHLEVPYGAYSSSANRLYTVQRFSVTYNYDSYRAVELSTPYDFTGVSADLDYLRTLYGLSVSRGGPKTSHASNVADFSGCPRLRYIKSVHEINGNIKLSSCPLVLESLENVINGLTDYSDLTFNSSTVIQQYIEIDSDQYALLTEDDITAISDKGWILTVDSDEDDTTE